MSEEAGSVATKLIDKLPDLHFDWYARFLPGAFVVLFYRYTKGGPYALEPSATKLLLLVGIAYLIGHVLQPLSSRCAVLSRLRKKGRELEGIYLVAKRDGSKFKSQTSKVTKAHAESVSMFSMSAGALLVWIKRGLLDDWRWGVLLVSVLLFALGIERVFARERKIEELKEMMK